MQKTPEACPVCGSDEIREFCKYESHALQICDRCDLVFQRHIDKLDLSSLINQVYDENWVNARNYYSRNAFEEHAIFNTLLLNIFLPHKGDLLEIGCGTGEFLFLGRESGWHVVGIEPSQAACRYMKQQYGIDAINSVWSPNLLHPKQKFDTVVFWHVLEHVADPLKFLIQVSSVLKPNGLILFSVPNKNSFMNTICGSASPLYTERDHLYHYSAKNLPILLGRAGLASITLFSREESTRFAGDLELARERLGGFELPSFQELMALRARLQANLEGHELVCVAKASS